MIVWRRLLLPLLWAAIVPCVAKDCHNRTTIVGVEGEDIVLSSSVPGHGSPQKIHWMKGGNIVASSIFPLEKKKQSLDSSGNLLIKNLSQEDAGYYTAENIIDEKITKKCFDLKILVQPDINCTVNKTTIQLDCTSASEEYLSLEYSWDYITNEEMTNVKDSVVLLPRSSKHFQKITCIVTAFSSSANNSINWSDCILLEKEPDHQSNTTLYIIIPIIILVLGFVFGFLYYKKKCLKKGGKIMSQNLEQTIQKQIVMKRDLSCEKKKEIHLMHLNKATWREKKKVKRDLSCEKKKEIHLMHLNKATWREKKKVKRDLSCEKKKEIHLMHLNKATWREKKKVKRDLSCEKKKEIHLMHLNKATWREKKKVKRDLSCEKKKEIHLMQLNKATWREKKKVKRDLSCEKKKEIHLMQLNKATWREKKKVKRDLSCEKKKEIHLMQLNKATWREKKKVKRVLSCEKKKEIHLMQLN
ncbi:uncharacterized protein [Erythrolamprus reginae]|uniref:uncharacterized protein isoform X1 n=1 Tax=Erythrolamprus reginae TaxID=121349 RepID=UPI00396CBC5C